MRAYAEGSQGGGNLQTSDMRERYRNGLDRRTRDSDTEEQSQERRKKLRLQNTHWGVFGILKSDSFFKWDDGALS